MYMKTIFYLRNHFGGSVRTLTAVVAAFLCAPCAAQVDSPDDGGQAATEEFLPDGTYVRTETSESEYTETLVPAAPRRSRLSSSRLSQMAQGERGKAWQMALGMGKLPDPQKSYKPSKKAAAADRLATDPSIRDGYSRPLRSIHAAYEQLDARLYPYKPYYEFPNYYVTHGTANAQTLDHDFMQLFRQGMRVQGTTQTLELLTYRMVDIPHMRRGYVAWDETVRNAFCAEFLADPMSPLAFDRFVRTLILDDAEAFSGVTYRMDIPEQGIISETQNIVLPWTDAADYEKMRSDRRDQALGVARSMTPPELVARSIRQWHAEMQQGDSIMDCALAYWKARLAYREIYLCHDCYDAASAEAGELMRLDTEADEAYERLGEIIEAVSNEPVAAPRRQSVPAAVSKQVVAAAKGEAGSAYESVIFLQKGWTLAGSQRSLPVVLVTREYGRRFLRQARFVQEKSGKTWAEGRFTEKQTKRLLAE